MILKKPFESMEVQQLAHALTQKWQRACEANRHLAALEQIIRDRGDEFRTVGERLAGGDGKLARAPQVVDRETREQLVLEEDLRHAVQAGELSLQYQPLFDVRTQRVTSIEALVRWQHPAKGWIPPSVFIPIAEKSGLILAVGDFVLRTACTQVMEWDRAGTPVVPVAVNVSAVQLERQNVTEFVRGILRDTAMPPSKLILELTESTMMENIQNHIGELQALRQDGVAIAIDDFGTGYSSLSYLRQLPLDSLKIDRSFIKQVDDNPFDESIVNAIVAMAHSLQLRVVAEGVETAAQLRVLAKDGCDVAQGFFFSRPLKAQDCRALLEAAAERPTFTETLRLMTNAAAALAPAPADDLVANL
jgi:EAL domain-containing protein (putative c-di-GMP-specific phosphodiesterase class I)